MQYGSWIKVSDFYISVEADDEKEALRKMKDALETISVKVLEEDENAYTELKCTITGVDPA